MMCKDQSISTYLQYIQYTYNISPDLEFMERPIFNIANLDTKEHIMQIEAKQKKKKKMESVEANAYT